MEGIENYDNNAAGGGGTEYPSVWFKKKEGSLVVSPTQLEFHPRNPKDGAPIAASWRTIQKHQVTPASHSKSLLKIILCPSAAAAAGSKAGNLTFQMIDRPTLERIRNEITQRLRATNNSNSMDTTTDSPLPNRKRSLPEISAAKGASATATPFGHMDPAAVAVARSALLAANPALRQQHNYLVTETSTVSEEDFWTTHHHLLEDEYARIAGVTQAGNPSVLQSHLPSAGKVTLGVQEMRQIFILYPAVHKAYEEKVPLELSDEQFWRKYLESEYFHRDRGRRGTVARNHSAAAAGSNDNNNDESKATGPTYEQQEARAAAVGTDDMFSRYDQKLQAAANHTAADSTPDLSRRKWGNRLAVGQFDLASTFETERGKLLEGPKDNHPPNADDNEGKGSRVIQKYNRHWAMVLHPQEAIAGADLAEAARRSSRDVLPGNRDAYAMGGVDAEMRRLVDFADASEDDVNHAVALSVHDIQYEPLTLANVAAYRFENQNPTEASAKSEEDEAKRHKDFARHLASETKLLVKKMLQQESESMCKLSDSCFPPEEFGTKLLKALTAKMVKDSQTEAQSLEIAKKLPDDFRERLQVYFRRSSELLRHFFGLRQMEGGADSQKKLARIVRGMETFYREMEGMRRDLPQTETGEIMRKMCLPIMDQLNSAFKLHGQRSGGRGGGFVTVD